LLIFADTSSSNSVSSEARITAVGICAATSVA
jgi:hypothetical protein